MLVLCVRSYPIAGSLHANGNPWSGEQEKRPLIVYLLLRPCIIQRNWAIR